jgi:hypothetical protein
MDSHSFSKLDPDPHLFKKLNPDPHQNNRCGSETLPEAVRKFAQLLHDEENLISTLAQISSSPVGVLHRHPLHSSAAV